MITNNILLPPVVILMSSNQFFKKHFFSLPKPHSHKTFIFFISHSKISSVLNETKAHSYCICQFPVNLSIEWAFAFFSIPYPEKNIRLPYGHPTTYYMWTIPDLPS